jgi:hypothetical protein
MVLAAPIFLVTQTKALSAFYSSNREPLLRLGLGATIAWLSLRLLAKHHEHAHLAGASERASRERAQLLSYFASASWLSATSAAVASALPGAREAALGAALAAAVRGAADAADEGAAAAGKGGPSWLPTGGVLERAQAARAAAVGAGSGGVEGGGRGAAGAAALLRKQEPALAEAAPAATGRRLI